MPDEDQMREAAEAMALALRDNGHDPEDDQGCPGCAALAQYLEAMESWPA